jgi:hypothetical protein
MRDKARCRLHGGESTGPKTFERVARIRSANTKTGRWSAAGRALELQRRRRWFWKTRMSDDAAPIGLALECDHDRDRARVGT